MPRPHRSDFVGAWHHVMNRGAGRQAIFIDDRDRERFLDELASSTIEARIEVHAYCLMGNHYHLLLRSLEGRLSAAMQRLSSRYTHYFNLGTSRDGALFRGRFNSVLIERDAHLMQTLRYIHHNPIEAGLASRAEGWLWSSAAAFLDPVQCAHWLQTDFLLSMFGAAPGASYRAFMSAGLDGKTRDF